MKKEKLNAIKQKLFELQNELQCSRCPNREDDNKLSAAIKSIYEARQYLNNIKDPE